jgi:hypothetical protein
VALALALLAGVLRVANHLRAAPLVPFATESSLIAALYSVWQLAGQLSVAGSTGAFARARWVDDVERDLRLPTEGSVQRLILGHPLLTQAANVYYATMHFGGLFVFLIWLFVRHRDRYAAVRTTLALTTLACLAIQLIPLAPPRLMPGYVDTAQRYGQSVYSLGFGADQLSAMPSVHVAWAVLIAWYVARIGRGPLRWLGVLHAALTAFVVVATANHWWLDGVVAVAVLVCCAWLRAGTSRLLRRNRSDTAVADTKAAIPATAVQG